MTSEKIINRVLEEVDNKKEEIISFLGELIARESLTGEEWNIQQVMSEKLKSMNLEVNMWEPELKEVQKHPGYVPVEKGYEKRPNVVGIYHGTGGGKSLLFNGHVDVVPAASENWDTDPWHAEIKNGRVYGRGASDMKSGLVAMTAAVETVLSCGPRPKGDIFLEYVMDEELSGNGTLACIQRGYKADAGISCEAGDLEIQPAVTGSMWFKIKIRGRSASMSRRWEAVSAIEKGYFICEAVKAFEEHRIETIKHPLYPDPAGSLACFVGQFKAGGYPSAPPASGTIKGRMGTLPGEDPKLAQQQFIDFITEEAKKDPWLRENPPEVKFEGFYAEPAEIDPDHPICKTLAASYEKVLGRPAIIKGHDGAADARFLIKYGNTPTPIFGPGTIAQMHADNEWVKVDDIISVTKVLAVTILDWCGYDES